MDRAAWYAAPAENFEDRVEFPPFLPVSSEDMFPNSCSTPNPSARSPTASAPNTERAMDAERHSPSSHRECDTSSTPNGSLDGTPLPYVGMTAPVNESAKSDETVVAHHESATAGDHDNESPTARKDESALLAPRSDGAETFAMLKNHLAAAQGAIDQFYARWVVCGNEIEGLMPSYDRFLDAASAAANQLEQDLLGIRARMTAALNGMETLMRGIQ